MTKKLGVRSGEVRLAGYRGKHRGPRRDDYRRPQPCSRELTVMLNVGRMSSFRYDMKEVLRRHKIEGPAASSLMASVIAKASRISIDSAIEYIREQERAGACSRAASEEMCELLDRFSKAR
ncbi:MAG: hypothetical protein QXJ32_03965 [Thermoplasmata archaeon]